MVEALITDCNGIARGKWLPVQKLDTIEKQGLKLPSQRWGSTCGVVIFLRWLTPMAISTDTATWSRVRFDPSD